MLVATCDDELIYCEQVEEFVIKLAGTLGIDIQCDKYLSGFELLQNNINKYQIIFLDIDMRDENGIQIAEMIRKKNQKVEIIFLTALVQYAVDGYKVRAYRFLIKPLKYEDFVFQVKELFMCLNKYEKSTLVMIKEGQKYVVKINDIMYIEVMNHDLTYYCTNNLFTAGGAMKKVQSDLKDYYFIRIHNSYLINMKYIKEVKSQSVIMKDGRQIPVSRKKREDFRQSYLEFWGDELG